MMEYKIVEDFQIVNEDRGSYLYINSPAIIPPITILYVDDDPLERWLAEQLFNAFPFQTNLLVVSNAAEALKALQDHYREYRRLPDLIMTDLIMPIMDGFELLECIQGLPIYIRDQTTLILVSEDFDESDLVRIRESKIINYLVKPLDKQIIYEYLNLSINRF